MLVEGVFQDSCCSGSSSRAFTLLANSSSLAEEASWNSSVKESNWDAEQMVVPGTKTVGEVSIWKEDDG